MCKHVAATLYGVGARLDQKPELLFKLRAVNENDLVADIGKVLPLSKKGPAAGKVLESDDMAALFGLDMDEADDEAAVVPPKAARKKAPAAKKAAAPPKAATKPPAVRQAPVVVKPATRTPAPARKRASALAR